MGETNKMVALELEKTRRCSAIGAAETKGGLATVTVRRAVLVALVTLARWVRLPQFDCGKIRVKVGHLITTMHPFPVIQRRGR
jgi:hypothetical protein